MIVDARYSSVWSGTVEFISKCKYNTETKEVFDISSDHEDINIEGLDVLEEELIELQDGTILDEEDDLVFNRR